MLGRPPDIVRRVRIPRGSRFRVPSGQITSDTLIGQWLSVLAQLSSVTRIVEIGTWRGGGSTKLIADALLRRETEAHAWCLEANEVMAAEARRRHAENPHITVIWGSIVTADDLDLTSLSPAEVKWSKQDLELLESCPQVSDHLPLGIDLLLLDGGEFSGEAEWSVLSDRVTGWALLDDTSTRKNANVLSAVSTDGRFEVIEVSPERNGTAIVRRRKDQ